MRAAAVAFVVALSLAGHAVAQIEADRQRALAELEELGALAVCAPSDIGRAEAAYRAATAELVAGDPAHRAARLALGTVYERCGAREDAITVYESLAPSLAADAALGALDEDGEVSRRYLEAHVDPPAVAEACDAECVRLRSVRVSGVRFEIVEREIESDMPEASVDLEAVLPEGRVTVAQLGLRAVGGWGAYFELRIQRVQAARGLLRIDVAARTGDYDECTAMHELREETWLCGVDVGRPVCWARIERRRARWSTVGRIAAGGVDAEERELCGLDDEDTGRLRAPRPERAARVVVRRDTVTVEDAIAPRLREPHGLRDLACLARPRDPPFECAPTE